MMVKSGWFYESHRHSLAARGIKTNYYTRKGVALLNNQIMRLDEEMKQAQTEEEKQRYGEAIDDLQRRLEVEKLNVGPAQPEAEPSLRRVVGSLAGKPTEQIITKFYIDDLTNDQKKEYFILRDESEDLKQQIDAQANDPSLSIMRKNLKQFEGRKVAANEAGDDELADKYADKINELHAMIEAREEESGVDPALRSRLSEVSNRIAELEGSLGRSGKRVFVPIGVLTESQIRGRMSEERFGEYKKLMDAKKKRIDELQNAAEGSNQRLVNLRLQANAAKAREQEVDKKVVFMEDLYDRGKLATMSEYTRLVNERAGLRKQLSESGAQELTLKKMVNVPELMSKDEQIAEIGRRMYSEFGDVASVRPTMKSGYPRTKNVPDIPVPGQAVTLTGREHLLKRYGAFEQGVRAVQPKGAVEIGSVVAPAGERKVIGAKIVREYRQPVEFAVERAKEKERQQKVILDAAREKSRQYRIPQQLDVEAKEAKKELEKDG